MENSDILEKSDILDKAKLARLIRTYAQHRTDASVYLNTAHYETNSQEWLEKAKSAMNNSDETWRAIVDMLY